MKKRILIFNNYYLPSKRYGGPVTSIRNTVDACCNEFDFYIIASNHDFGDGALFSDIHKGWNQVGNAKVLYISDRYFDFNMKNLRKLFEDIHPDLIWFSGILRPQIRLFTMKLSKRTNIPVLFSPRGELSEDRVALKAYKKKPYLLLVSKLGFYKEAWFHITSRDEYKGLMKFIKVQKERIFLVRNIAAAPEKERKDYLKEKGSVKIVFISRIHMVKNLKFAILAATKVKGNVQFDIYGPIETPKYWKECEDIIKQAPDNIKVNYCGILMSHEVGEIFKKYDCFLFPTINENYGHVIAESLANGCPVILSRGTTPWDDLDNTAGFVCNLNKEEEFLKAITRITDMNVREFSKLSNNAVRYYQKKLNEDGSINGHKNMFNRILEIKKEKNS